MITKLIALVLCLALPLDSKPLNVVFIVGDDLGWNDVGFHNEDIKTPVLDKLAKEGVTFSNAYVQPLCTPHAFMTGTYPFRAGLQNGVIGSSNPVCSPLNRTFFPEKLQTLGYRTHMVGKWHLGFCNWNCTPTYRGFDSFFGYYNGMEDYYTKEIGGGIDLHDNKENIKDEEYSVFAYSKRASDIISGHDVSKPLFLYMPFQSVHSPIEVPQQYEDMYPNIQTEGRKKFSGMVSAMDEAIGNITQALTEKGLMEDTVIIFTADNGGLPMAYGNNYPLRGTKATIFEGGTKASSFIYGAGLDNPGRVYDGMLHAVDWHPTILAIAGGEADPDIDGINMWEEIQQGKDSKRSEFVYNLDDSDNPVNGAAAIRWRDYKLIAGYPGRFTGWYKPDTLFNSSHFGNSATLNSEDEDGLYSHLFKTAPRSQYSKASFEGEGLYNLKDDPNEHTDLSEMYPDIVKELKAKLDGYRKNYVPPNKPPPDPAADPSHYGGFWTPGWC